MNSICERSSCIICENNNLIEVFENDHEIPVGNYPVNLDEECYKILYNVQCCTNCGSAQTKYTANPDLIYCNNNAHAIGTTRSNMDILFSNFILSNKNIINVLEIGAGSGILADYILKNNQSISYTVVDTSFWGKNPTINVINKYFEKMDISLITQNTIIMSHVFEHFFNPRNILKILKKANTVKYIYINFPNLEYFVNNNIYYLLNCEHTFYIPTNYIEELFKQFNFRLQRTVYYENYSIFFEFERSECLPITDVNEKKCSLNIINKFFENINNKIRYVNTYINNLNSNIPIYIWPCSIHTLFVLSYGLDSTRIKSVLDNSPHKIGKYLYYYKLYCESFNNIIQSNENKLIILTGGNFNSEIIERITLNHYNNILTV